MGRRPINRPLRVIDSAGLLTWMDRTEAGSQGEGSPEVPRTAGHLGSIGALIAVAAIWGVTFPLVHDGIVGVDILPFLQVRFLVAAGLLVPVAIMRSGLSQLAHPRCLAPGALLAAGYLLQTEGLRTTSPSVSAFLTGTSVVIVPLIGTLLRWEKGSSRRWLAVILALAGIFLLQGARLPDRWSAGESATLLCAIAFAVQILLVGRLSPGAKDPLAFAAGQIAVAAIGLLVAGLFRSEVFATARITRAALSAALFTGFFATAVAFLAQTWAQRRVGASVVAVCFASEPVFAAVVSVLLYGDRLPVVAWGGAGLVTLAMTIVAAGPGGRARRGSPAG